MQVVSEETYLASKDVLFSTSGYCLDKLRCNRQLRTERGRRAFAKECESAEQEYQAKRTAAKEEYKTLCEEGVMRPPSPLERRLMIANGHPDNRATQAARRLLAKQGINWQTGQPMKSERKVEEIHE